MDKPNNNNPPLCSKKVLKDAIDILQSALIDIQSQNPPVKHVNIIENQLNVEILREFMIRVAEPLFNATSVNDLITYKYIYRDMWKKLFIISCKVCIEYDKYVDALKNFSEALTSNVTLFEKSLPLDSFDNAMYKFGFNIGESLDDAIEQMFERVARYSVIKLDNTLEEEENAEDDIECINDQFVGLTLENLDRSDDNEDSRAVDSP